MTNIVKLNPQGGQSPEEVRDWFDELVKKGNVQVCVVGVIAEGDDDDSDTMHWNGAGTRSNIFWLIHVMLNSLKRAWM